MKRIFVPTRGGSDWQRLLAKPSLHWKMGASAMTAAAAQQKMRGSRRWWSQEEGLALFLVVDRFVPDWPKRAFADQPALGIDLLRLAAGDPPKGSPAA